MTIAYDYIICKMFYKGDPYVLQLNFLGTTDRDISFDVLFGPPALSCEVSFICRSHNCTSLTLRAFQELFLNGLSLFKTGKMDSITDVNDLGASYIVFVGSFRKAPFSMRFDFSLRLLENDVVWGWCVCLEVNRGGCFVESPCAIEPSMSVCRDILEQALPF